MNTFSPLDYCLETRRAQAHRASRRARRLNNRPPAKLGLFTPISIQGD
jgi:hypothetical protein